MTLQQILTYAQSKPAAEHEYKTEWEADILKIKGKMFAFLGGDKENNRILNLKNDPQTNIELREKYPDLVKAGYYSNKTHWNSWYYDKTDEKILKSQIDRSYELVAGKQK